MIKMFYRNALIQKKETGVNFVYDFDLKYLYVYNILEDM